MYANVLLSRKEVTAVKFFKKYILAGIGSVINVFEKETGILVEAFPVLEAANIGGFVESQCGQKVLVYGNKQCSILVLVGEPKVAIFEHLNTISCDDWIQHALWINDDNIALLTSHNTVNYINLITDEVEKNESEDNSLLYSGLLVPVGTWLIVMAGTVFSQIAIRWSAAGNARILHRLAGHRGVIFSISCDPHKGLIVSTSDDRSVRIWHMRDPSNRPPHSIDFWENITIECTAEVYGHTARVMRNVIVNDLVISGGEDSSICYWRDGKLARKVPAHQTASIWCMDSDGEYLVTGGGDGAVVLHPLTVASDYGDKQLLELDKRENKKIQTNIKTVCFTSRKNLVLLNAEQHRPKSELIYYDIETKSQLVFKLDHKSTYKMLALSDCKQLVAVADMFGKLDVFAEPCRDEERVEKLIDTKLNIGKIGSMHFAGNRHLVLCGTGGKITVVTASAGAVVTYTNFLLPPCKERWLTACAMDAAHEIIIVADRCGGVHVYSKDTCLPVRTFEKVHGRYGSTSLTIRDDTLISTGRDGTIKYFAIDRQNLSSCRYLYSRELDFNWVEKFLSNKLRLVCGFQETTFVVYNMQTNTKIIQTVCGGGHRAYDVMRHFQKVDGDYEPFVRLVYVKSSNIHLIDFRLNLIESKIIRNGTHSKTINSLAVFSVKDIPMSFYVSGGEDTTLRVSSVDKLFDFQDRFIFKHLSNVRTVKVVPFEDEFVVFSAGGRAQISVNKLHITYPESPDNPDQRVPKIRSELLKSFWFKGSDEQKQKIFKRARPKIDFDPEMRVMDLDVISYDKLRYFVFVGCSDGYLRIFNFYIETTQSGEFVLLKEVKIPEGGCVLKVRCIELFANLHVVVASMTTGQVIIWNVLYDEDDIEDIYVTECFVDQPHRAGVNSLAYRVVEDDWLLLATGGDDNRVVLTLLNVRGRDRTNFVERESQWYSDGYHSSQITGLEFFSKDLLLTASIDQRVTVLRWKKIRNTVKCFYVDQICSDVSDIQGMAVVEYKSTVSMAVCVHGRGLEVRVIPLPAPHTPPAHAPPR